MGIRVELFLCKWKGQEPKWTNSQTVNHPQNLNNEKHTQIAW